ncbi:MAG: hypothetical protein JNL10_00550 [Verrucomicrobiales bacterium]|nr:hypothetical protein [Verrucomicrobiales bacterium]
MALFTKAEIRRAIDQARKHLARKQEPRAPKREPLPSERAAARLAEGWATSSGLDLKALEALRKQHRKELDSAIPKRSADAARRWSKHIRATQAEIAERLENAHATAPAGNFFPPGLLLLDTPIGLISADDSLIQSRRIEAQRSFAKFRVDRRSSGIDQVSFLYLFRNDLSAPFLYNFLAVQSISGHANLWLDGNPSYPFSNDFGLVTLDVRVDVVPASLTTESSRVLNMSGVALNGPSYWENDTKDQTFSQGGFVTANGLVLRPGQTAVIVVSATVKSEIDDGHLVIDLDQGDFGFRSPGVLVVPKRQLFELNIPSGLILTPV